MRPLWLNDSCEREHPLFRFPALQQMKISTAWARRRDSVTMLCGVCEKAYDIPIMNMNSVRRLSLTQKGWEGIMPGTDTKRIIITKAVEEHSSTQQITHSGLPPRFWQLSMAIDTMALTKTHPALKCTQNPSARFSNGSYMWKVNI